MEQARGSVRLQRSSGGQYSLTVPEDVIDESELEKGDEILIQLTGRRRFSAVSLDELVEEAFPTDSPTPTAD